MKKKSVRILFQGDSITDCGRSRDTELPNIQLGQGYVLSVAGQLLCYNPSEKMEIFNRGISGNRVVDLYARWKIDALNLKPDIISILIGVNDTWHEFTRQNGVEVSRYEDLYRMLLAWTKKELPKTKIVLCEPFVLPCGVVTKPWVTEINARRKVVAKLAKEFGTVFVELQEPFNKVAKLAPNEHWLGDGVHPTCAGHTLIADLWLQATEKILN